MNSTTKRFPRTRVLLIVAGVFIFVSFCGWLVFKQIGGTCFNSRPESITNPPTMPGAEGIEFGTSSFNPHEGYTGKLTQFQTANNPTDAYQFYVTILHKDGWSEDLAQRAVTVPSTIDAKFDWECSGMSSTQHIADLWFHAETIASGKSIVTLNNEYASR